MAFKDPCGKNGGGRPTQLTNRDLPALKDLIDRPGLDQIEDAVDSVLTSDEKLARQVKLYLCHRHSGIKLSDIGKRFGIGGSGVTQASRRIGMKATKDRTLRNIVKRAEAKINLSNA